LELESVAAGAGVAGSAAAVPGSVLVAELCPLSNENDPATKNIAATIAQLMPEPGTNEAN
jgi:hypothetical protein